MFNDGDAYNIAKIYEQIENELIADMMRNLSRHRAEELKEGYDWEQWQVLQLQALEEYRKKNLKYIPQFESVEKRMAEAIRNANEQGGADAEKHILRALKRGAKATRQGSERFFQVNQDRVNALIQASLGENRSATTALLRKADDEYRKIIYKTQIQASTGSITYEKAVDLATKDFLTRGIQCIQYRNGAMHQISTYTEMAMRTSMKRAYMQGEGTKRLEWGITTVIVNHRNHACSKCLPFVGKVLIDDVYGGGSPFTQKDYPTLSSAMEAGLFHPNCKDGLSTYFEGITDKPKPMTKQEKAYAEAYENVEANKNVAERKAQAFDRLAEYALDPADQRMYRARANEWRERKETLAEEMKEITKAETEIKPLTDAEKEALEWYVSGDGMWINQYLRGRGDFGSLSSNEELLLESLTTATSKPLEPYDKLYRSVDAKAIFGNLSEDDLWNLQQHLLYGDKAYDKGAYSQSIKQRMESILNRTVGKEITEKGFMSTTASKEVAEMFGDFTGSENPVVIEFDTKGKKLKGVNLDFLDVGDNPQVERLLARDTKYKVNDISVATDSNGGRYIKINAEILGQGEEMAEAVAEAVQETVETAPASILNPVDFTPATTIGEAEAYAQNFVGGGFNLTGKSVSFKGFDVDIANRINKRLAELYDTFDIPKLSSLESYGKANKRAWNMSPDAPMFATNFGNLGLNSTLVKSSKAIDKYIKDGEESFKKVMDNIETLTGRSRELAEKYKKAGRSLVGDSIEDYITHEMGHHISYNPAVNQQLSAINTDTDWMKYAETLSGYANATFGEYVAESFTAFCKGEKIQPEMEAIFMGLVR